MVLLEGCGYGPVYELLTYCDDVDLEKKLAEWERFYDYDRPDAAHRAKTPYKAPRETLQ